MKNLTIIYLLCGLFLFTGCDIKKQAIKSKAEVQEQTDTVETATKVTEEKREGGQIQTPIIPYEDRERDTSGAIKELIQEIKDGGLTKTITYRPDGGVDVECTADEIWVRIEEQLEKRESKQRAEETLQKQKEKEESFDSTAFLYGVLGFAVIVLGAIFIVLRMVLSQGKALKVLAAQAANLWYFGWSAPGVILVYEPSGWLAFKRELINTGRGRPIWMDGGGVYWLN